MAGNDWINSYLEAILDAGGAAGEISAAAGGGSGVAGASGEKRDKSSLMLRERGRFSPARYFVEEVISGFDETDLYKTWVRVSPFTACRCRLQLMPIPRFLALFCFWCDCFLAYFWMLDSDIGDEEPSGEEHAAGEHVLEDLEPRQEEEAGIHVCC